LPDNIYYKGRAFSGSAFSFCTFHKICLKQNFVHIKMYPAIVIVVLYDILICGYRLFPFDAEFSQLTNWITAFAGMTTHKIKCHRVVVAISTPIENSK